MSLACCLRVADLPIMSYVKATRRFVDSVQSDFRITLSDTGNSVRHLDLEL